MSELPKSTGLSDLDELCVQTIRFLAADAVQKANAGHPGMPMGMAAPAYVLWDRHLKFNPANPLWPNRDRFVLSAGHGCMLLYALLYLTGYDMSLDDLKNFRQWGSKTPGHPEYHPSRGIEATTGPLGQGISNSVGMALAQKYLSNFFNREGFDILNYKIYTIAGDGCLQEGISSEASSLAGHLKLNNLIVVYDDNHITIDGPTELSFTENVAQRYKAYGWFVQEVPGDGVDMLTFEKALKRAQREKNRPCMIKIRTHIAFGAPTMQDTAKAHGAPLGGEEIEKTKIRFGWDPKKTFNVPDDALNHMRLAIEKGKKLQAAWERKFKKYALVFPELAKQFTDAIEGRLPVNIDELLPKFDPAKPMATRSASGKVLNALMPKMPLVLGGSADLTPSNDTWFDGAKNFEAGAYDGRYLRFGVREHAMGAIMNGISVSGLARAYGGTFFVFSDYMRASVRMAALSHYPTIFVYTHDSIGLGEDGPTHQPVEHIPAMRAMPNLIVLRPADANETAQAWKYALEHKDGPVALLLTRQGCPVLDQTKYAPATNLSKGAYTLIGDANPQVLLIATGSEVGPTLGAYDKLKAEGVPARVVSMPSWELFGKQSQEYRDSVLLPNVKARVGVEAAVELGWSKWLGCKGVFVGMKTFGASAPGKVCFEKFGFTPDNIVKAAKQALANCT